MRRYKPQECLKSFVKSYMVIESSLGMENSILPDTSVVMAFRLKGVVLDKAQAGNHILPDNVFSGLRQRPRIIHYTPDTATLLVNFNEGGASAFFDVPMHDFFGQNIPLNDLVPASELREVSEKLCQAKTDLIKIMHIEQYLVDKMNGRTADSLIMAGVQKIKQKKGDLRISQLIKDLCISKDPFEKRFRQTIGATPKQFAQIVRLSSSIRNYSLNKSLTEISLDAGYYDQSHYIKEFKLFTGQTPFQFFRSPRF